MDKILFLPVPVRGFFIHGFENIRKGLLALISGRKRNFKDWSVGKNKQFCGFGQLAALYIIMDCQPYRTCEHSVQMILLNNVQPRNRFQVQFFMQVAFDIVDCRHYIFDIPGIAASSFLSAL